MKFWPFMFAASKTLDYRFVVRPDFLDASQANQLREAIQNQDSAADFQTMSLRDENGQVFSGIYRSGAAILDGDVQADAAGRELLVMAGIVVGGSVDGSNRQVCLDMIDRLGPFLQKTSSSFLKADADWQPITVPAFDLPISETKPIVKTTYPTSWQLAMKQNATSVFLLVLLVLMTSAYLSERAKIGDLTAQLSQQLDKTKSVTTDSAGKDLRSTGISSPKAGMTSSESRDGVPSGSVVPKSVDP